MGYLFVWSFLGGLPGWLTGALRCEFDALDEVRLCLGVIFFRGEGLGWTGLDWTGDRGMDMDMDEYDYMTGATHEGGLK